MRSDEPASHDCRWATSSESGTVISMPAIRVLVTDRERIVAQAIARSLDAEPEFAVVGRASTTTEAVRATLAMRPDVVVLDETVAEPSVGEVMERLRAGNPAVKLVVTSPQNHSSVACECVTRGSFGVRHEGR